MVKIKNYNQKKKKKILKFRVKEYLEYYYLKKKYIYISKYYIILNFKVFPKIGFCYTVIYVFN